MLRRLFGWKPKPATLPPEDRPRAITAGPTLPSTLVVREVLDDNFDAVVLQSDRLTVVDFWAEWCQPCTIMDAYMGWLVRDYGEQVAVVALDVDENPQIPERYNVLGMPTLIFFRNGVEVDRQTGLLSYEELQAKVAALLAQVAN